MCERALVSPESCASWRFRIRAFRALAYETELTSPEKRRSPIDIHNIHNILMIMDVPLTTRARYCFIAVRIIAEQLCAIAREATFPYDSILRFCSRSQQHFYSPPFGSILATLNDTSLEYRDTGILSVHRHFGIH